MERLFAAPASCPGTEAARPESDAEKDLDQGSVCGSWGPRLSQFLARRGSRSRYQEGSTTPELGRYLA